MNSLKGESDTSPYSYLILLYSEFIDESLFFKKNETTSSEQQSEMIGLTCFSGDAQPYPSLKVNHVHDLLRSSGITGHIITGIRTSLTHENVICLKTVQQGFQLVIVFN